MRTFMPMQFCQFNFDFNFDFVWGSAPDPAGVAHSASPNPLAGFKGSNFYREKRGKGEKKERERKEKRKEKKEKVKRGKRGKKRGKY